MKKKLIVPLFSIIMILLVLCGNCFTAFASNNDNNVFVSTARIIAVEENGETKYQLAVTVKNNLEDNDNGKIVGLHVLSSAINIDS